MSAEWLKLARCTGAGTYFFGRMKNGELPKQSQRNFNGPDEANPTTAALCGSCPVRVECLDWALKNNESGVWANTTERERKQMKRAKAS